LDGIQERLLKRFTAIMPLGQKILLSADRFYGTASCVQFCKNWGWQYRIRLKGNLIFCLPEGDTLTMDEAHARRITVCKNLTFNNTTTHTHIGILHEAGHPEPWFIAMDAVPARKTVLEYGKRWTIKTMFSDFKSRGFSLTHSKLTDCNRMECLILVMAIALIITTFVNPPPSLYPKKCLKNLCSHFTTGIRTSSVPSVMPSPYHQSLS
jgi:hypothetical protein